MKKYADFIDTDDMKIISEIQDSLRVKSCTFIRNEKKIGRNDYCKCGSGKKYKKCCIKNHNK
jgi:uncharacterized protein YecA (UPF0149 family)